MSWEGPDPVRDEDTPSPVPFPTLNGAPQRMVNGLPMCAFCTLGFHTPDLETAPAGCGCLGYGCGCRQKREQKEAA